MKQIEASYSIKLQTITKMLVGRVGEGKQELQSQKNAQNQLIVVKVTK